MIQLLELVNRCVSLEPSKRPTFDVVLEKLLDVAGTPTNALSQESVGAGSVSIATPHAPVHDYNACRCALM